MARSLGTLIVNKSFGSGCSPPPEPGRDFPVPDLSCHASEKFCRPPIASAILFRIGFVGESLRSVINSLSPSLSSLLSFSRTASLVLGSISLYFLRFIFTASAALIHLTDCFSITWQPSLVALCDLFISCFPFPPSRKPLTLNLKVERIFSNPSGWCGRILISLMTGIDLHPLSSPHILHTMLQVISRTVSDLFPVVFW